MTRRYSADVERLIRAKMASGQYASEEDLLLDALRSLEADERELRAIQDGIDSFDRGEEGVSLEEAFDKIRKKHPPQGPS